MEAPFVILVDIVPGTSTNDEGTKLYAALAPYFAANKVVRLSLRDAAPMSSSFLNSSIGDLVDEFGIDSLRHCLKLVDYLPSHAAIIKKYLDNLATLHVA